MTNFVLNAGGSSLLKKKNRLNDKSVKVEDLELYISNVMFKTTAVYNKWKADFN